MTPSLERLNELVRQAEAKSRSKKLEAETRQAAEKLREAEQRARLAARRLREERPVWVKKLDQADVDEQQLKDLVKKLAQFKSALDPASDPEGLIDSARGEIDELRRTARAAMETLTREADDARKVLRAAMEVYSQHRRELDRLQPKQAEVFAAEDRLLWDSETHFPGGLLYALAREVEAGAPFFGMLSRPEQYAQLKIWIGRYRQFQDDGDPEADPHAPPDPEAAELTQAHAQRVFHTLKGLSKQYEPGYIDAFRLDFTADWPAYVSEAQGQLQQAVEAAKQARERNAQAGAAAAAATAAPPMPLSLSPSAPVTATAEPPHDDDGSDVPRVDDLLAVTRGRRALMIGGPVREDARRTLLSLFGFDRLEWEPYDESRPGSLDQIEQRVRDRAVDLVLLLRGVVGPSVSDRLRPACQQSGVPCVLVERGYGPTQVEEALRRTLPRSA